MFWGRVKAELFDCESDDRDLLRVLWNDRDDLCPLSFDLWGFSVSSDAGKETTCHRNKAENISLKRLQTAFMCVQRTICLLVTHWILNKVKKTLIKVFIQLTESLNKIHSFSFLVEILKSRILKKGKESNLLISEPFLSVFSKSRSSSTSFPVGASRTLNAFLCNFTSIPFVNT